MYNINLIWKERCVRMFNRKLEIGEGQKYDISQVSTEGISKEERAELEKKNRRLIDIFKAFDENGDGSLSDVELAKAMDAFAKMDTKDDDKLSKKELRAGAEALNKQFEDKDLNITASGLRDFMQSVKKLAKHDAQASTDKVIQDYQTEQQNRIEAEARARAELEAKQRAEAEAREKAELEAKQRADREAAALAEQKRLAAPTNYTVQPNDTIDGLLRRSLEAQGKEISEENLAEAKAEFIKNNPKAIHGKKGKEYLYMGDVIKIAGGLEDKANAAQIQADYRAAQAEAQQKAQEEERLKAQQEAKLKTQQEAELKGQKEPPAGDVESDKKSAVIKPDGADSVTGKLGDKDFTDVKNHGMCKYNPDLKGYEPYTGLYDGKYYENGEVKTLAKKTEVDYYREYKIKNYGQDYADKHPTKDSNKYNTYQYQNGSLTPLYRDPTFDSNVQIKIGDKTFEMAKGPTSGYAHWDYQDFLERFVDEETGAIRAKNYTANVYYLKSGDTQYPVRMDLQTKALMVEINGQKYDMNDLMTGKVKI